MHSSSAPALPVNEIRDYLQVNAHVAKILDTGVPYLRLTGVENQRLLLSGLSGAWRAVIGIEGRAGPELAASLQAPELLILARSGVADGAGRSLRSGSLVVLGPAADALAYRQAGGLILAVGPVGARAGLEQESGRLFLLGPAGRLVGDRQRGGRLFALGQPRGEAAGHAHRAGYLGFDSHGLDASDRRVLERCRQTLQGRLTDRELNVLDALLGRPSPSGPAEVPNP